MKKIAILVAVAIVGVATTSCSEKASAKVNVANVQKAQERDQKSSEVAEIKFDKELHDFGKIKEGDVVSTTFKFTNVGKGDLVITNASSSCGCTVPNISQIKGKVYKTGEGGEFTVKFDSKNKPKLTTKVINIVANTVRKTEQVRIKVFAEPDPKAAEKRKADQARRAAAAAAKKKEQTPLMLQNVK